MKDASKLIEKLRSGKATEKEKELLDRWLHELGGNDPVSYSSEELEQIKKRGRIMLAPYLKERKIAKLWPRIAVAASVALAIMTAGYFYYKTEQKTETKLAYQNDIAPGRNGATLTLADGRKIQIDGSMTGKIAEQAGIKISMTKDGQVIYEALNNDNTQIKNQINTLSTTNGETYRLRLPDGSEVWLNAASTISYPANFSALKERRVELSGEAYFEVARDSSRPFKVTANDQEIEVLGTHFNINAYRNESTTATTLLEGTVKIQSKGKKIILEPGQEALSGKDLTVRPANPETAIDWKNGDFNFDNVDFKTAMRKIGRWYNVEIIYDSSIPEDLVSGGWISRKNNISTVLRLIEKSGQVHFRVEGKKVFVSK